METNRDGPSYHITQIRVPSDARHEYNTRRMTSNLVQKDGLNRTDGNAAI
jgi:hypothetical protein